MDKKPSPLKYAGLLFRYNEIDDFLLYRYIKRSDRSMHQPSVYSYRRLWSFQHLYFLCTIRMHALMIKELSLDRKSVV